MEKLRIIVADSDEQVGSSVAKCFNSDKYELVSFVTNGKDCIDSIRDNKVDIILAELTMPIMDGYDVLEYVNGMPIDERPKVFIVSNLKAEEYITRALRLNAVYCFFKPVQYDVIANSMLRYLHSSPFSFSQNSKSSMSLNTSIYKNVSYTSHKDNSFEEEIAKIFISLGIPAHIRGYQFLRSAIKCVVENPSLINNITKQLYPTVAVSFSTTSSKVERAIRHAIDVAWSRGKLDNINKIFGFKIYSPNEKPTNGEFIALLADKFMIEHAI